MASKIFENEHYANELLRSCHLAWEEEGRYLDVTLCIGDRKIAAHKLVLCGLSDYFKTLFQIDGQDSSEIVLKEVDFEALQSLIKYAYTGRVEINQTNIQELLSSADYFQVTSVKTACEEFLIGHVSLESCVDLIVLAGKYSLRELSDHSLTYLGEEFEKIYITDQFLELPVEVVLQFLKSNELVLLRNKMPILGEEMELSLFRGVLRYISHSEFGSKHMTALLRSVRLPFIYKKTILAELKKWPHLKGNKEIQTILELLDKYPKTEMPEFWITPRKCPAIRKRYDSAYCANGGHILTSGNCTIHSRFDNLSTSTDTRIVQITLWIRRFRLWDDILVLGGIAIKYSNGETFRHGERAKGHIRVSTHVIDLGDDESITQVRGRHGWLVDQLCFTADNGREFGPFGGDGGSPFTCTPTGNGESVYLHAFCGDIVYTHGYTALINLGFIWKYYDRNASTRN